MQHAALNACLGVVLLGVPSHPANELAEPLLIAADSMLLQLVCDVF